MTTEQLAAAMERNAYTLDDGTPCRCERCAHHRDAAQRMRELEAVRVAAVTYAVRTGHHEDCDESFGGDCECGHDALRAALARVGGGT